MAKNALGGRGAGGLRAYIGLRRLWGACVRVRAVPVRRRGVVCSARRPASGSSARRPGPRVSHFRLCRLFGVNCVPASTDGCFAPFVLAYRGVSTTLPPASPPRRMLTVLRCSQVPPLPSMEAGCRRERPALEAEA